MGRATVGNIYDNPELLGISIHALRGEGDPEKLFHGALIYISIHALRGEGDVFNNMKLYTTNRFQSTPSVGRATAKSAST